MWNTTKGSRTALFYIYYFITRFCPNPGAAYGVFAGHDASRGLATFQLDRETIKDEYDDLSDLTDGEREQMMEWQMQFSGKNT